MSRRHMVVLAILPLLAAGTEFAGRYSGTRVRAKGDEPTCLVEDSVSAIIQGASLTLNDSTLHDFVTSFDPNPDGAFGQTYVDAGGGTLQIRGRITQQSVIKTTFLLYEAGADAISAA